MIPYGRQDIQPEDIDAVLSVLQSDFLTQGEAVPRFEQALCELSGGQFAVAMNSATSALHVACLALGVGAGDWVWTSPNSFVASANCALYCGARVDFVDIDPQTLNMSVSALAEKLKLSAGKNQLPKVVIPVHFAGQACDMAAIKKLADEYGFAIIEDASHAIGGRYASGEKIGACCYSDITVFSFHPVKIVTTAEGGAALTNRADLAEKMRLLRSHGVTRDANLMTQAPDGAWYYQQIDLGFNYRMTDLQAALGCSQLRRLDAYIAKRHEIAVRYMDALQDLPLTLPSFDAASALHLFVVQVEERKRVFDALRAAGIGVNVHYMPIYRQPFYQRFGFSPADFPHAEHYYARAISLPIFPKLSAGNQEKVILELKKALSA